VLEHLLEWYLIYRNEAKMASLIPEGLGDCKIWSDRTGVNLFAEATIV
jgi:extracellular factor (EF) 3-hydroxypalmitic acid methyl ester biosynthesis protein